MRTTVIAVLDQEDKAAALRSAIEAGGAVFRVDIHDLRSIPRSPFAYWLSPKLRELLSSEFTIHSQGGVAKQGLATGDNFRHVRVWWETTSGEATWKPFANGGQLSPFYADVLQTVGYDEAHQEAIKRTGRYGRGSTFYGRPGLTWAVRSSRFAPSALPAGCLFSTRGLCAFTPDPLLWLALMNSLPFDFVFKVHLGRFGFPEFLAGVVPMLPVPTLKDDAVEKLESLARRGWQAQRMFYGASQTSHAFVLPGILQVPGREFGNRTASWAERVARSQAELSHVQDEIDALSFDLYGINDADRRVIRAGFGVMEDDVDAVHPEDHENSGSVAELDPAALAADLVAWAVGVAAGRFDIRLATGERERPQEPDPFDPLPVCSPGMLTGDDGLPMSSAPDSYPIEPSPVLVDDPGHGLDLTALVRAVFEAVFGDQADGWWSDIGAVLDPKNGVEGWLRRGYFDHHLKTYSKSRRKAPVMWPIGTKSGAYRVWLYAHQVTGDTLFRVLTDVVEPKLATELRRLSDLTQEFGPSPSAAQRRTLDAQQALVDEVIELRNEMRAVAPLWHPDLNDGTVIVLAPLWRLFSHHRAWSNELKSRWGKLAEGDYDWAQLAIHLWPERVIPECAEDRSLAIAHDLEETFWIQDDDNPGRWHPRQIPTTPIGQLIAERTNTTIHAARNHPTP